MRILLAAVCLITVIQMTVAATSAVEEAFLSRLDRSKIYNSKSLVENLQSAVGDVLKDRSQVDYEIAKSFIKDNFGLQSVMVGTVKTIFNDFYGSYRSKWLADMQDTLIKELGFDTKNKELIRDIKAKPDAYSINFETWKILMYNI